MIAILSDVMMRPVRLLGLAAIYAIALLLVVYDFLSTLPQSRDLLDFGAFVASARAAATGKDPYGPYSFVSSSVFGDLPANYPNLNPPISVLVFQPIQQLEPVSAFHAWYYASLAIYLALIGILAHTHRKQIRALHVVWALGLAGFWSGLFLGQIYVGLFLASAAAWISLRQGHHSVAGLLIGMVVAIKPNFVVWPLLLFAAGYIAAPLWALVSCGLLSLIPLVVYGPQIYSSWIETVRSYGMLASPRSFEMITSPTNASLIGLAARWGLPWLAMPLAGALLTVIAIWTWRRRPAILLTSNLGLLASLLTAPIAWAGYTVLLLPTFFERRWTALMGISAFLLLFPDPIAWNLSRQSPWHFLIFGSVYGIALLLVLAALTKEALRPSEKMI